MVTPSKPVTCLPGASPEVRATADAANTALSGKVAFAADHRADVDAPATRQLGHEFRRVRSDLVQTRWTCMPLTPITDTMRAVRLETSAYARGEITGEAALAGIVRALSLSAQFSERVEG